MIKKRSTLRKRLISGVLALILTLNGSVYSLNLWALDNNNDLDKEDSNPILIVSEKDREEKNIIQSIEGHVVDNELVDSYTNAKDSEIRAFNKDIDIEKYRHPLKTDITVSKSVKIKDIAEKRIIIDSDALNNKKLQIEIVKAFRGNAKIAVMKNDVNINEVASFLEIGKNFPADYLKNDNSELTCIGYVFFKDIDGELVINKINSVKKYDSEDNKKTMIYALKSKNIEKFKKGNKLYGETNILKQNTVSAAALEWSPVQPYATCGSIDRYYEGIVNYVGLLQKNPNNPTSPGYYDRMYFWVKNHADVSISPSIWKSTGNLIYFKTREVKLAASGDTYGQVYYFTPSDSTSTDQLQITFPWGVSAPVNVGLTVSNKKINGGNNTPYAQISFKPKGLLGNYDTSSTISAEMGVEMWQDRFNCYKYNGTTPYVTYFRGKSSYSVTFVKCEQFGSRSISTTYTPITRSNSSVANGY